MQNETDKAAGFLAKRFISGDSVDTPNGKVTAVSIIKDAIQSQIFNYDITPADITRMQEKLPTSWSGKAV